VRFDSAHTSSLSRRDWTIAGAIFVVALLARLIFLFNAPDRDWPHSVFYEGDAVMWVEWAAALDRNEAFEFNLPIHPPGVAYPMAWLYRGVHERGFLNTKVLWCAMSAAACAMTYLACAVPLGRRVGAIAALLLAFSFGQYVLATSLNSETPYVLLLTAMVLLTQGVMAQPTRWTIAGLGAIHGISMLLRPEHPLLMLMWLAWIVIARRPCGAASSIAKDSRQGLPLRARLTSASLVALIAVLVCSPWTVRAALSVKRFNAIELDPVKFNLAPAVWREDAQTALNRMPTFARQRNFELISAWAQRQNMTQASAADVDRFFTEVFDGYKPRALSPIVLVSNQGPFSFALANHPQSEGGFSRIALEHPMLGRDPTFELAFSPHNRTFNEGWRVGWGYISDDPGAWVALIGRKLQRFADGVTCGFGASNAPLGREGARHRVDMLTAQGTLARVWQIVLLALITAGLILVLARRIPIALWLLIILYKIIVTILFYGYARQGASIAPAFFILIAITIDSILLLVDRRAPGWKEWQRIIAMSLCASMLLLDLVFSRGGETVIIGHTTPRPEFGQGAWTSFDEIEIRKAP
jgi:hypothetical protein